MLLVLPAFGPFAVGVVIVSTIALARAGEARLIGDY